MNDEYTAKIRLRFWQNVNHSDGCLEWIGVRLPAGYGKIRVGKQTQLAHRVAWEMFHEDILSPDTTIMHKCDNPPCVRPLHLFKGTQQDNMADKVAKGRYRNHNSLKTQCKHGHPFTTENTLITKGGRTCRECARQRKAKFKAKHLDPEKNS